MSKEVDSSTHQIIVSTTSSYTPFESPKRISAFKAVEMKSTTIARSPLSKIFEEMEPLIQPIFLQTPRHGLFEQMIYLKTPDLRLNYTSGKLDEKLDFDSLAGSNKKQLEIIQDGNSNDDYKQSFYDEEQYQSQQEMQESQEKSPIAQIPANIASHTKPIIMLQPTNTTTTQPHIETKTQKICCNCKKSRCLKLYCQCFRSNQLCHGCNCVQCLNTDPNNPERYKAFIAMIEANPQAFCPKIEMAKHTKGCNCKKSSCQKKYCECYQAGLPCSDLCRCEDCKNTKDGHCNHKRKMSTQTKEIDI